MRQGAFQRNLILLNGLILFALSISLSAESPELNYARHSFDGLIINENAVLGVCGEMKYIRQRRNCVDASVSDLKQCLKLDSIDPMFKEGETTTYNCVNSSSSGGAEVIRSLLETSESEDSCLAQNVRFFYEQLIESEDFRTISHEFETNLGTPLVLNFAIDIRDSISSLQLDLSELQVPGVDQEPVNLNITSFNKNAPCQSLSKEIIFNRVTEELTRLTMINSRQKFNPYGDEGELPINQRVFDSSRFSKAKSQGTYEVDQPDERKVDLR